MAALCPSMLSQNAGASRSGARQEWWINPDSAPGSHPHVLDGNNANTELIKPANWESVLPQFKLLLSQADV
ncbi:hypothetical protein Y1Q_0006554 [Alligator mississippiensis]|uniref:Uncharacterized protein n=1 Tax=Alligator mississippiensis TaxID=8496 RepID=A0A151NTB0_ALLMI|nr:hypothetical protein Y1Q_0006554 [Alligator mississippiensis]